MSSRVSTNLHRKVIRVPGPVPDRLDDSVHTLPSQRRWKSFNTFALGIPSNFPQNSIFIDSDRSRRCHSYSDRPPSLPSAHSTGAVTHTGLLHVSWRFSRSRVRLVCLKRGLLTVHLNTEASSRVIWRVSMNEARNFTVDSVHNRLHITTKLGIWFTISMPTISLLMQWARALRHAYRNRLYSFYDTSSKRVLSRGRNSRVYTAESVDRGDTVVVKTLAKTIDAQDRTYLVYKETDLLSSMAHPNIVRSFGVFESNDNVHLVMEHAENGNLSKEMENGVFENSPITAMNTMRHVIAGVAHLHDRAILHRNINPENILVFSDGRAVLCDLGMALAPGEGRDDYERCYLEAKSVFTCPEIWSCVQYGMSADIYSCGVLLFTLLTGAMPFSHVKSWEDYTEIVEGRVSFPTDVWDGFPPEIVYLVKRMLRRDPGDRPTAREILRDDCFRRNMFAVQDQEALSYGVTYGN